MAASLKHFYLKLICLKEEIRPDDCPNFLCYQTTVSQVYNQPFRFLRVKKEANGFKQWNYPINMFVLVPPTKQENILMY